jgi:hypothetical protein
MTDDATTLRSRAEIATPQASRYLQQLCKHFAHKLPVTHDAESGRIAFSVGLCDLLASEGRLRLDCTSPDAEQLHRLEDVVARHLIRFAFREGLRIVWQPA